MQSEDFDNKVRNAAEHHHPAYDEKAWNKMEQLLNTHLPEKKDDRKRRFLFILLFLLSAGSAWLIATKPWDKNKTSATAKQESSVAGQQAVVHQNNSSAIKTSIDNIKQQEQNNKENKTEVVTITNTDKVSASMITAISASPKTPGENKNDVSVAVLKKNKTTIPFTSRKIKQQEDNNNNTTNIAVLQKQLQAADKLQPAVADAEATKDNSKQNSIAAPTKNTNETVALTTDAEKDMGDSKATADNKTDVVAITEAKDSDTKNKTDSKKVTAKKRGYFFFSVSTGPDLSFAGSGKTGTAKLLTGAGLGYTFGNKLTLRSGFYSSRKIYSSAPDAYHPPADFYTYYPYLQKVDADCKVYEIPLLVSYSFGKSSKQNWFASTGLSSYLMKSEVYNYDYKTTYTGPTMKGKWTVNNANKHFFSVFNLSGGYQRNLNKHISFTVEPYIKLPLTGVGYGKVKLNSGGVLFTVGIKPFK